MYVVCKINGKTVKKNTEESKRRQVGSAKFSGNKGGNCGWQIYRV